MLQKREKISEISALATNEATLESMLNRIIDTWKKTDFRLVKDHSKDTFIITGTDEIQILLEESQVKNDYSCFISILVKIIIILFFKRSQCLQ